MGCQIQARNTTEHIDYLASVHRLHWPSSELANLGVASGQNKTWDQLQYPTCIHSPSSRFRPLVVFHSRPGSLEVRACIRVSRNVDCGFMQKTPRVNNKSPTDAKTNTHFGEGEVACFGVGKLPGPFFPGIRIF